MATTGALQQRSTDIAQDFLLGAYRRMQTIRMFEQRVLQLSRGDAPEVVGSVHLCAGQEAIPVGALAALRPDDRVVATYRTRQGEARRDRLLLRRARVPRCISPHPGGLAGSRGNRRSRKEKA